MTKQEIRSLIKNLLPKIDETNKYHDLVIDAACETVLNTLIQDYFNRESNNVDKFTKRFGDDVVITIGHDEVTSVYYSNLPVSFVPLSDKASGIRRIYTAEMGGIKFYPMDAREADLAYSNSNFYLLSNKIGYIVYPTRVEYFGMTEAIRSGGIRMDIVVRYRDYEDTDEVLLPGDKIISDQNSPFIIAVLGILGVIQPVNLNDNNKDDVIPNTK